MMTDPRRIDMHSFDGGLDEKENEWTIYEVCESVSKFFAAIGRGIMRLLRLSRRD